jgi:transposase
MSIYTLYDILYNNLLKKYNDDIYDISIKYFSIVIITVSYKTISYIYKNKKESAI